MEAIGLVLNIAPLVIELIKANPETLHALQALHKDSAKYMAEEFYEDLHYEVCMLKLTLAKLVNDLPVESQWKDKITNEKSLDPDVWRNPPNELQLALQRRLHPCYELFTHCMEKILKILGKLVADKSLPVALAEDDIV
jgi:hypothetical protein